VVRWRFSLSFFCQKCKILHSSLQYCEGENATLAEIMSYKENKDIDAVITASNMALACNHQFWFGLVTQNGYMWFEDSKNNVSYRNFQDFTAEAGYLGVVYYGLLCRFRFEVSVYKWNVSAPDALDACAVCQKGERRAPQCE
jgi:hypothetical protein